MKKKFLISSLILLITMAGLSQDTSKLANSKYLKRNSDTSNTIVQPPTGTANLNNNPGPPNTTINSNAGTAIPNTTSGTLGSSVNPNTQVVIPIKGKRKANVHVTPDWETNAPK